MWQLELLSWVVPAFGALAKEFLDSGPDADLFRSAQDCYSDLVNIGLAISTSRGEWFSGLEDEQISRLLKAFESRIPNRRVPFIFSMPNKVCSNMPIKGLVINVAHHHRTGDRYAI